MKATLTWNSPRDMKRQVGMVLARSFQRQKATAPALCLLVALLIFGAASTLAAQPNQGAQQRYSDTNQAKQGSERNPVVVKILPSPDDEAKTAKEKEHGSNEARIAEYTAGLFWVTLALAIFTAFLFGATAWLVKDAKDTARRQLRAYLVVDECDIRYTDVPCIPKGKPTVTIVVSNHGQTPADHVMVVGGLFVTDQINATNIVGRSVETVPKGRLGRNQPKRHRLKKHGEKLTQLEVNQITAGTHFLVASGDIRYTDIFKDEWILHFEFAVGNGLDRAAFEDGPMSHSIRGQTECQNKKERN